MNYYKEHKMNGINERLVVGTFCIVIIRGRRFILPNMNRYFPFVCFAITFTILKLYAVIVINLLIRRETLVFPKSIKNYIYRQNCNFSCCLIQV